MAVASTIRELEVQSPGVRDTVQSYPVVVKSPELRPGGACRGTRERLAPRGGESRENIRPAGQKRTSVTDRDEDAVAMAAVSAAVPDVVPAPPVASMEDADDAVHTRSTEYLSPLKSKRTGRTVAVVGGLVVLVMGGGVALMGGGERAATSVHVTPPPLPMAELPPEPPLQPKDVKVAEASVGSQGARPEAPEPPPEVIEAAREEKPPPASPARDVRPAGASSMPEEARAAPAVVKPKSPAPPPVRDAGAPRVFESAPARKASVVAKGRLEFRIRPYAVVSLDGKVLGQTPFAAVEVSEGRHTVRLVNKDLGKDVTRTIDVKAGQSNVFKLNLETE